MRRWNGWGDTSIHMEVPPAGKGLLAEWVGEAAPVADIALPQYLEKVPESRLPEHPLCSADKKNRLDHAHGQSLPDWVAMRQGLLSTFPDVVAHPGGAEEVEEVLSFAEKNEALVIPYGGGTSVVGHLSVPKSDRPVISLSLERLNRLLSLDSANNLATFEAGVVGPDIEAQLRGHGYTLGHFPQSFEYSSLGGWVVTRSSGQQSMHYGRMDNLFAGGEMLTPTGRLTMPPLPASAAGPDLRQVVLGSEGRMGVITKVVCRVSALPQKDEFFGMFFPSFSHGMEAVREMARARLPLSMIRLSNAAETATNMALAGHETQMNLLKKYLSIRGLDRNEACMCLVGVIGRRSLAAQGKNAVLAIAKKRRGVYVGKPMGAAWEKKRFLAPYLRNSLWDAGYAVDTLETCVTWDKVAPVMQSVERAISGAMAREGEKAHVFTHLSHVYASGSSVYTTFIWRLADSPQKTLERWRAMKEAASAAIVEAGGTISHQHGVGEDHKPYLPAEKGELGMKLIRSLVKTADPDGRMNPGKLLD
ncbi:MAG: FAD-binding oxidoreductase [Deltaproteobacteria bacterium]|nr:FAD-binding oxidoreductase [Deltaproteobacteria bacterium]